MQVLILSHDDKLIGEVELSNYTHTKGIVIIPINRFITNKVENLCTSEELKNLNRLQMESKEIMFESNWVGRFRVLYCSTPHDSEVVTIAINKQKQVIKV